MKLLRLVKKAVVGFGLAVGMGACAQMALYFYQLVVMGLPSVVVYEPDPVIRVGEFVMAIAGFFSMFVVAWHVMESKASKPLGFTPRVLTVKERVALFGRVN